jgi:hypothetical protein
MAGTAGAGEKNNSFLAETLFKLQFFGTSYSFHPIHFQKHMTGGSDMRGTIAVHHVVEEPRWAAGGSASTRSTTGGRVCERSCRPATYRRRSWCGWWQL